MTEQEIKKKLRKELQIDEFGKNTFGDLTFKLSQSDPNFHHMIWKFVAIGPEDEIVITAEWDKKPPSDIEEIEDRLTDIVNTKDIEDVKAATKKIKDTAKKLPRKKMTLEDFINGQSV